MGNSDSSSKKSGNTVAGRAYPSVNYADSGSDTTGATASAQMQLQAQPKATMATVASTARTDNVQVKLPEFMASRCHSWKVGDKVQYPFAGDGVMYLGTILEVHGDDVVAAADVGPGRESRRVTLRGNVHGLTQARFRDTASIARIHRDEDRRQKIKELGLQCTCGPYMECWCILKNELPTGYNRVLVGAGGADEARATASDTVTIHRAYVDPIVDMYAEMDSASALEVKRSVPETIEAKVPTIDSVGSGSAAEEPAVTPVENISHSAGMPVMHTDEDEPLYPSLA